MEVILYHQQTCPQCRLLERKLKEHAISYESCEDVDKMISLGLSQTPALEVDGNLLYGKDMYDWINRDNN